jgi:hypothetical protein
MTMTDAQPDHIREWVLLKLDLPVTADSAAVRRAFFDRIDLADSSDEENALLAMFVANQEIPAPSHREIKQELGVLAAQSLAEQFFKLSVDERQTQFAMLKKQWSGFPKVWNRVSVLEAGLNLDVTEPSGLTHQTQTLRAIILELAVLPLAERSRRACEWMVQARHEHESWDEAITQLRGTDIEIAEAGARFLLDMSDDSSLGDISDVSITSVSPEITQQIYREAGAERNKHTSAIALMALVVVSSIIGMMVANGRVDRVRQTPLKPSQTQLTDKEQKAWQRMMSQYIPQPSQPSNIPIDKNGKPVSNSYITVEGYMAIANKYLNNGAKILNSNDLALVRSWRDELTKFRSQNPALTPDETTRGDVIATMVLLRRLNARLNEQLERLED